MLYIPQGEINTSDNTTAVEPPPVWCAALHRHVNTTAERKRRAFFIPTACYSWCVVLRIYATILDRENRGK